jgi:pentafunctional AROM polypeptide
VWQDSLYGSSLAGSKSLKNIVPMKEKYIQLHKYGDSIKLISRAKRIEDNYALEHFKSSTISTLKLFPKKPLIAINMGSVGQISRALNSYMTPVTHPLLPVAAAPGQLSVEEIFKFRSLLGLVSTKQFYLFGSPISQSMSPTLHNTGFQVLGLPYHYSLSESADWTHVKSVLEDKCSVFGGASVTIPLKEEIIKHNLVSSLTEAAKTIGAGKLIFLVLMQLSASLMHLFNYFLGFA